jgi:hypothetical protein
MKHKILTTKGKRKTLLWSNPTKGGCAGSYLSSYHLLSTLKLSLNSIQNHQTNQPQNDTYYRLQLPDNDAKMLVYIYA